MGCANSAPGNIESAQKTGKIPQASSQFSGREDGKSIKQSEAIASSKYEYDKIGSDHEVEESIQRNDQSLEMETHGQGDPDYIEGGGGKSDQLLAVSDRVARNGMRGLYQNGQIPMLFIFKVRTLVETWKPTRAKRVS